MTKVEAMNKVLRVQRYILDQEDFRGFDILQKCFLGIVEEIKSEAKARKAGRTGQALMKASA